MVKTTECGPLAPDPFQPLVPSPCAPVSELPSLPGGRSDAQASQQQPRATYETREEPLLDLDNDFDGVKTGAGQAQDPTARSSLIPGASTATQTSARGTSRGRGRGSRSRSKPPLVITPLDRFVRFKDAAGNSPSPAQLFKVLDRLEKYASGDREHDQLCTEINQQHAASIRHGLHRYFAGDTERVSALLTFVEALRKCLSEVPSESHHLPYSQPLQYVGFAINEQQQSAAPEKKCGWLMALFDAACKLEVQQPDKSAVFAFKSYSVAYPVNWEECMLGEEFFARICKTYFYTGLGFNVHQAGLSIDVTVLDDLRYTEGLETWEAREQLRTANPVFEAQIYF
jgi:hypothetical protein